MAVSHHPNEAIGMLSYMVARDSGGTCAKEVSTSAAIFSLLPNSSASTTCFDADWESDITENGKP